MARTVIVRPRARDDLARIAARIAETVSHASAVKWRVQIESAIRHLASTADQWPEADEAAEVDPNLRYRLFGRHRHVYRILFSILESQVHIHRIRHAAQDWISADDL